MVVIPIHLHRYERKRYYEISILLEQHRLCGLNSQAVGRWLSLWGGYGYKGIQTSCFPYPFILAPPPFLLAFAFKPFYECKALRKAVYFFLYFSRVPLPPSCTSHPHFPGFPLPPSCTCHPLFPGFPLPPFLHFPPSFPQVPAPPFLHFPFPFPRVPASPFLHFPPPSPRVPASPFLHFPPLFPRFPLPPSCTSHPFCPSSRIPRACTSHALFPGFPLTTCAVSYFWCELAQQDSQRKVTANCPCVSS